MATANGRTTHQGIRDSWRTRERRARYRWIIRQQSLSLLHATYHRPGGPWEVVQAWLSAAVEPERVEYVLACDEDDQLGEHNDWLANVKIIRNPVDALWSTAVRNWNAAADASTGDLLVVVADDLFPPRGWDEILFEVVSGIDPQVTPFAVKLKDDPRSTDVLMRHPVLSRAFFDQYGLFDDHFHSVYCDNDFTYRAFWKAFILDGRRVVLDHRHPSSYAGMRMTESHRRNNRPLEDEHGVAQFHRNWSFWQRVALPQLVSAGQVESMVAEDRERLLRRRRRAATVTPSLLAGRRLAARLWRRCRDWLHGTTDEVL